MVDISIGVADTGVTAAAASAPMKLRRFVTDQRGARSKYDNETTP